MRISFLVTEHGFSFINQAQALIRGLNESDVATQLVKISSTQDYLRQIQDFSPNFILSVGDWHDFNLLVKQPQASGFRVVPWLVADDSSGIAYVPQYNEINLLLTTSANCKSILIKNGIKESIIKILPEAVDMDFWRPLSLEEIQPTLDILSLTKETANFSPRFNLIQAKKEGIPIIFTTGGDATAKGAREVMKALATLDPNTPWIYLIKIWPSPKALQHAQEELALAESYHLTEKIRYIVGEFSSDFMLTLFNACDVYAAPSHHEGFGLPLVEAQACGKPVISIDATASKETVIHGQTGFLAKPDSTTKEIQADTNDLAQYLNRLLTDPGLRSQMGEAAKQHATATYSPAVVAKQLLSALAAI